LARAGEDGCRRERDAFARRPAQACVYAQNYGEAGAIDYFGPELWPPAGDLPHNSYWMWGPGGCNGAVVLIIGGGSRGSHQIFRERRALGGLSLRDCMPYESDLTIWVARNHTVPVAEAWRESHHYD
jgi:hypothetical protein